MATAPTVQIAHIAPTHSDRDVRDASAPRRARSICLTGSRAVAMGRVRDRPGVAELRRLYVLGPPRGQGVGGVLLDAAIAHAPRTRRARPLSRTRPRADQGIQRRLIRCS